MQGDHRVNAEAATEDGEAGGEESEEGGERGIQRSVVIYPATPRQHYGVAPPQCSATSPLHDFIITAPPCPQTVLPWAVLCCVVPHYLQVHCLACIDEPLEEVRLLPLDVKEEEGGLDAALEAVYKVSCIKGEAALEVVYKVRCIGEMYRVQGEMYKR